MTIISTALQNLRPASKWTIRGESYEGLEWLDENQTKPTEEEITQELERLKAEYELTQYQRQRAPEYPAITDQLDALFHAGVFPPEMAEQIQAIKDKYPKPEINN
jgi:hypothetical protein